MVPLFLSILLAQRMSCTSPAEVYDQTSPYPACQSTPTAPNTPAAQAMQNFRATHFKADPLNVPVGIVQAYNMVQDVREGLSNHKNNWDQEKQNFAKAFLDDYRIELSQLRTSQAELLRCSRSQQAECEFRRQIVQEFYPRLLSDSRYYLGASIHPNQKDNPNSPKLRRANTTLDSFNSARGTQWAPLTADETQAVTASFSRHSDNVKLARVRSQTQYARYLDMLTAFPALHYLPMAKPKLEDVENALQKTVADLNQDLQIVEDLSTKVSPETANKIHATLELFGPMNRYLARNPSKCGIASRLFAENQGKQNKLLLLSIAGTVSLGYWMPPLATWVVSGSLGTLSTISMWEDHARFVREVQRTAGSQYVAARIGDSGTRRMESYEEFFKTVMDPHINHDDLIRWHDEEDQTVGQTGSTILSYLILANGGRLMKQIPKLGKNSQRLPGAVGAADGGAGAKGSPSPPSAF